MEIMYYTQSYYGIISSGYVKWTILSKQFLSDLYILFAF